MGLGLVLLLLGGMPLVPLLLAITVIALCMIYVIRRPEKIPQHRTTTAEVSLEQEKELPQHIRDNHKIEREQGDRQPHPT